MMAVLSLCLDYRTGYGFPSQTWLATRTGRSAQTVRRLLRKIAALGWLDVSERGSGRGLEYRLKGGPLRLPIYPQPLSPVTGGPLSPVAGGPLSPVTPISSRRISTYDDEVVVALKTHGVTDTQLSALERMGRVLSAEVIEREIRWIRAGKRSSAKVRSEAAMLFTALRDDLPPPSDVIAEQAHANRLALEVDDLTRRRAEAAESRTPEAIAASRAAIAAAKQRLQKGTA